MNTPRSKRLKRGALSTNEDLDQPTTNTNDIGKGPNKKRPRTIVDTPLAISANYFGPTGQDSTEQQLCVPVEHIVLGLRQDHTGLNIPCDIRPATFTQHGEGHFQVFESSDGDLQHDPLACVGSNLRENKRQSRKKREATLEDKVYRSDREFVKRHSHRKMIWFFRKVGLRHPAAIRTHLERVKHPEFELPNLQCAYPHPELSVACDDKFEDENEDQIGKKQGSRTENITNMTYYQMYCPTPSLVERVKKMIGKPKEHDTDYNKKVLTFIADIVGRLLWHNNRTHTVMFAKSDHYDRDCFILYSRQAEPTPFMMRSDSFFCRRHDSEKFKYIAPQPDLTRANSSRLSNDSSIYVVGCDPVEVWETFPYDYRADRHRPMKALYDQIKKIDPSVMEQAFASLNAYVNGGREHSTYVDVASKTSCDLLSVLLGDLKNTTNTDHNPYQDFVERFVTTGILNVQSMLRLYSGGTSQRLDRIVLHHVRYRREVRELRTNRAYYYRNSNGFICSLSLLDDLFEDRNLVEEDSQNDRLVYFYDLIQPFEYDEETHCDVNDLVLHFWDEVSTMIHESSHTIGQQFTDDLVKKPPPDDPFYPRSDMSAVDLAIDRVLERAIKYSKKIKLLTPREEAKCRPGPSKRKRPKTTNVSLPPSLLVDLDPNVDRNAVLSSLSMSGENRLRDGYVSPTRPDFEVGRHIKDHHVEHDGQHYHLKISYGGTNTDYGPAPKLLVDNTLACVYTIDPKETRQIKLSHGSTIMNKNDPCYTSLRTTDRVVRVFVIKALIENNTYAVRPYIFFVFRNMPTCEIEKFLAQRIFNQEANGCTVRSQESDFKFRPPQELTETPQCGGSGTVFGPQENDFKFRPPQEPTETPRECGGSGTVFGPQENDFKFRPHHSPCLAESTQSDGRPTSVSYFWSNFDWGRDEQQQQCPPLDVYESVFDAYAFTDTDLNNTTDFTDDLRP